MSVRECLDIHEETVGVTQESFVFNPVDRESQRTENLVFGLGAIDMMETNGPHLARSKRRVGWENDANSILGLGEAINEPSVVVGLFFLQLIKRVPHLMIREVVENATIFVSHAQARHEGPKRQEELVKRLI
jgi:hypothetical protein